MKDPAALFYFNDWMGGTATMSRHLKGCYIDLLCVQFNSGKLSLDDIKTVLGSDFGSSWPTLQKKFTFVDNYYFNERLMIEQERRNNFTESRRKSSHSRFKDHTIDRMENRNEDINIIKIELPNWLNLKAWEAWLKYKKERKQKMPPSTIEFQLKKLEKDIPNHAEMIKNSITNGWTGFFFIGEKTDRTVVSHQKYTEHEDKQERKITSEENKRRIELLGQSKKLSEQFSSK